MQSGAECRERHPTSPFHRARSSVLRCVRDELQAPRAWFACPMDGTRAALILGAFRSLFPRWERRCPPRPILLRARVLEPRGVAEATACGFPAISAAPGQWVGHLVRTHREIIPMKAIVVTDQAAGTAGMKLAERPEPQAAINDVVVQVHASGFVPTELAWPSTWTDRRDRDRTPSIPGHELAGVVTALGYGTTGLSIG